MALIDEHVNEAVLKNLDRKENFTLFGLTVPYLFLIFFLIIIPVVFHRKRWVVFF